MRNNIHLVIHYLIFIACILAISGCKFYYGAFYTDPQKCFGDALREKPYDIVIVPGFPSDSGKINTTLSERILWADYLYKNGIANQILFSGSAVYTPFIEGEIMRLFALQLGIDENEIKVETKALHSTENLYYGFKMASESGYEKIAFATHPAQSSFLKQFRRKFNLDLDFIPIVADSIKNIKYSFQSIYLSKIFVEDFIPLNERQGLFKKLRGTRGGRVKKEIRKEKRSND
jgi:uncharacterized SAM-binding protein YcdF (DUF218 family)